MPDSDLVQADPLDPRKPLQLPLTGAWFCKTFSPMLMPPLYGVGLAVFAGTSLLSHGQRVHESIDEGYLCELLDRYPTSLYPILSLLLQTRAFAAEQWGAECSLNAGLEGLGWRPGERSSELVEIEQLIGLGQSSGSVDVYRLNNVIHQSQRRADILREAARVVRPGGLLLLTDNTAQWVEGIWSVRLARAAGRPRLAQRLIQDKLKSSGQRLVPDAHWWASHLDECWEVVALRPFFSKSAMTVASLFESLNFKQGGPGPDWLTRRIVRNPILRRVYRWLLANLARVLIRMEPELVARSGATSLMVVLRRRAGV